MNESIQLKDKARGSLNERLLFISNYYDYQMYCFKRKMSTPKMLMDSKAWYPLSFSLEILSP